MSAIGTTSSRADIAVPEDTALAAEVRDLFTQNRTSVAEARHSSYLDLARVKLAPFPRALRAALTRDQLSTHSSRLR